MFRNRISPAAVFASILFVCISGSSQEGGRPQRIVLSINEGRPLAAAASKLQDKYGIPVSYEDVKWSNATELIPLGSVPGNRGASLRNPDRTSPGIALVDIQLDQDEKTHRPITPLSLVLPDLVIQHTARRNPGEFRVLNLPNDGGFVIAPSRGKDAAGAIRTVLSPLDARISFSTQKRTDDEGLAAIIDAVRAQTGETIALFFNKRPLEGTAQFGADNEVAREVLARLFRTYYQGKQSWQLLYDPGEHWWALNIQSVYVDFVTAKGTVGISPVFWPTPPKLDQ